MRVVVLVGISPLLYGTFLFAARKVEGDPALRRLTSIMATARNGGYAIRVSTEPPRQVQGRTLFGRTSSTQRTKTSTTAMGDEDKRWAAASPFLSHLVAPDGDNLVVVPRKGAR